MGALSTRNRSPAPPMPTRKRSISGPRHAPSASASASSASSFASSASFFDRIKGQMGYSSSRTSIEDDGANAGFKGEGEPPYSQEDNVRYSVHSSNGDGSTVWSRVAAAAGNLTINVSKTWAASIATYTGEYTPPGQESRLLRGMKAYHLAKAHDPSDLPSWLFEPHERGRFKREDRQGGDEEDPNPRASSYKEPPKPRSLRAVYEAAAATSSPTPRTIRGADGNEARPSRATDRLQAMRQARRGLSGGIVLMLLQWVVMYDPRRAVWMVAVILLQTMVSDVSRVWAFHQDQHERDDTRVDEQSAMVPLTDAPMISMFAESGPLNFFPVVVCTCAKYNVASVVLIGLLKESA
ncbi:hypothetical protein PTI98_003242 [Pleurotus ostreatus]|nr:hypothetical protein PTI98_003242 [Pleurotus ostreatus]